MILKFEEWKAVRTAENVVKEAEDVLEATKNLDQLDNEEEETKEEETEVKGPETGSDCWIKREEGVAKGTVKEVEDGSVTVELEDGTEVKVSSAEVLDKAPEEPKKED